MFFKVLLPVRGLKMAKNVPKNANIGVFCHFICENWLRIVFRNAFVIQVKFFCIFWQHLLATSKTSRVSLWTLRTQRNIRYITQRDNSNTNCGYIYSHSAGVGKGNYGFVGGLIEGGVSCFE